jgi:hypothetical protein
MAVTIITTPKDYSPVYNEMVYTASSTNVAQTNFSFLVDIYINGSGTKTARLRIPPEPNGNYCVVDIHRVLEASANSVLFDTSDTNDYEEAPDSIVEYIVKFGEEYGTTITQYPDLTVDSTRYAINGSLERNEFIDYDWADYTPLDSTKKFLTNSPSTLYTSINDYGVLTCFNNINNDGYAITTLDANGSPNGFFSISITGVPEGELVHYKSNPASINNIDASNITVSSGALPIIDSDVASYIIWTWDTLTITESSERKTFVIREDCKSDLVRLIFLNKLGGWDSFNFYLVNNEMSEIERKMYKQNPNRLDGSGNYTYSKSDREKVQYYTKTMPKKKVTSDWLTEAEDAWLLELIESPEIYLQSGSDLIAVANIDLTSHTKRKHVSEKLFNLEFNIEFGWDNYRQRG